MRLKLGLLSLSLIAATAMQAQVAIGTDAPPEQFAALQIDGVNQGLRLSTLTTTERNSLAVAGNSAAKGLMIYNTTTSAIEFYDGTRWQSLSNNISAVINGIHRDPAAGIELGGALTENTVITQGTFAMNFPTNGGTFSVNNDVLAITNSNVSINADSFVVKNGSNDAFKIKRNGTSNKITTDGVLNVNNNALNVTGSKTTINGTLTYVDGSQGAGKVLTSNANGVASWKVLQPATSTKNFVISITEGNPNSSPGSSNLLSTTERSITNDLFLEPGKWIIAGTLYTYVLNRTTTGAPVIEIKLATGSSNTALYTTGNVPELKAAANNRSGGSFAAIPINCLLEVPAGGLTVRIRASTTQSTSGANGMYLIRNYEWLTGNPGGSIFRATRIND